MRVFLLFILLISFSFSQNITYFVNISAETICPGDVLAMETIATNGRPAAGVELRLVLHSPYQGLRAIKKTNTNGQANATLTKPGLYRIYINTEEYNHPQYVEFNYSAMCPPLPPKAFNITVMPDCNESQLLINVTDKGKPIEEAYVSTLTWASTTSFLGVVVFPLEEGQVLIRANKTGYAPQEFWTNISCVLPPPPECLANESCADNQYCLNETCINVTGECGYAENHTWVSYDCCEDDDCGYGMICKNRSCLIKPVPIENLSNITEKNETAELEEETDETNIVYYILVAVLILICAIVLLKRSGLPG